MISDFLCSGVIPPVIQCEIRQASLSGWLGVVKAYRSDDHLSKNLDSEILWRGPYPVAKDQQGAAEACVAWCASNGITKYLGPITSGMVGTR